jgi:lipopolysaccharide transport system permease protein
MNSKQEPRWSRIISPQVNPFRIDLKELVSYKDLLFILVRRDIIAIYKQTVLGPIWFLFGPIFTALTFTFTFSAIAHISTDGLPGPLFYLSGTILWNYFQAVFGNASNTFTSNAHIFSKVYFPRIIPSLSSVISNLLKLGLQLLVFLIFLIYYASHHKAHPNHYIFLFPLLVIIMGLMGLGMGLVISSLTVKYRDMNQLTGPMIMLIMYASPIIYPSSSVPEFLKPYIHLNPLVPIIDIFRYSFTGAGAHDSYGLLYSFVFSVLLLFSGIFIFNRVEKDFIDSF